MRTRLLKDARILAGPAALIAAATALALAWDPGADPVTATRAPALRIAAIGFYLGTALLVALPFGTEFHHRTIVLLLAQPASRARLWLEKWGVLVGVVAVVTAVEFAALQAGPFSGRPVGGPLLFLVAMLSSGMFWTLVAGSTIGGVTFSLAGVMMLELAATLALWLLSGVDVQPLEGHPVLTVVRLAYAVVTACLGWWTFARYEVRSGAESVAADALGGSRIFGFVRCQPAGVLTNLVRKEVRLHQPTFLLAAMLVVCWMAALAVFAAAPGRPRAAEIVFSVLTFVYVPLALVVAGTVPIGEESALGVRAWQLTLPVSARVQWGLKLAVMVLVSAALLVGLPMLLMELTPLALDSTTVSTLVQMPTTPAFFAALAAAIVAAFWAASLLGHTVRAGAAAGAILLGLWLCASAADWAGRTFGLGSHVMTRIMVGAQLSPEAFFQPWMMRRGTDAALAIVFAIAVLALAQSYSAFRRIDVDRWQAARYAAHLAGLTFLLTFGVATYVHAAASQYASAPVREFTAALQSMTWPPPSGSGADWQPVALAELEATGQLSADTRAWLAGSQIAVRPGPPSRAPGAADPRVRRRACFARVLFAGTRGTREFRLIFYTSPSDQ